MSRVSSDTGTTLVIREVWRERRSYLRTDRRQDTKEDDNSLWCLKVRLTFHRDYPLGHSVPLSLWIHHWLFLVKYSFRWSIFLAAFGTLYDWNKETRHAVIIITRLITNHFEDTKDKLFKKRTNDFGLNLPKNSSSFIIFITFLRYVYYFRNAENEFLYNTEDLYLFLRLSEIFNGFICISKWTTPSVSPSLLIK